MFQIVTLCIVLSGFHLADGILKDQSIKKIKTIKSLSSLGAATSIKLERKSVKHHWRSHIGQNNLNENVQASKVVHKTAYFGKLLVGTPSQEFSVVFDSGSGNLIVPGVDCTSEACKVHARFDEHASSTSQRLPCEGVAQSDSNDEVSVTFGTGEIWGRCMRDKLCIGHVCSEGSFIASTYESSTPFGQFAFDGVLGLALVEMSQGPAFNMMERMKHSQILRSPIYSVFLSDDSSENSEITFGDIKSEHLASNLIWADVSRNTGYWEVHMDDITFDGEPQKLCVDCRVAVDTGTSELAGPSEIIDKLSALLNVDKACNNFDSLPKLGFVVNGHVLNLDPVDYVDKEAGWCDVALMPLDVPPPNGPLFVFGIPFLQRFYTVYNASSRQVGFGVARHASESDSADSELRLHRVDDLTASRPERRSRWQRLRGI